MSYGWPLRADGW